MSSYEYVSYSERTVLGGNIGAHAGRLRSVFRFLSPNASRILTDHQIVKVGCPHRPRQISESTPKKKVRRTTRNLRADRQHGKQTNQKTESKLISPRMPLSIFGSVWCRFVVGLAVWLRYITHVTWRIMMQTELGLFSANGLMDECLR